MHTQNVARASPATAGGDPPNFERLPGAFDVSTDTAIGNADQDWLRRNFIVECAETIESLAISLREAAWRGSDVTAEVLGQIRQTLISAIGTFKEIGASTGAGASND